MSKYTTEVRFICESLSGLNESVGCDNVDEVISKSWDKIFTTNTEFFDENYKSVICQKILKHYYLREIGCETFGVWKLWVNTKLEEIMPYYNKLYNAEKIKFDPMNDTNLTRTHTKKVDENSNNDGTINNNSTSNNTRRDLYSDTPQGALTGVENEEYLTNARKTTDTNTNTITGATNTTANLNSTEDYLETIIGKQNAESFSELLVKYRKSLINIDMQIIDEFSELFINLW